MEVRRDPADDHATGLIVEIASQGGVCVKFKRVVKGSNQTGVNQPTVWGAAIFDCN